MSPAPQRAWRPDAAAVHPDLLEAMRQPMLTADSAAGRAVRERVQDGLRMLFRTRRPVALATCTDAGMLEAAIRSGVRERILCVVSGQDGERFARTAERCDKEVIRLHVPRGEALEPELLAGMLEGPPVDAVALVHAESGTGVQHPIAALLRLVRPMPDVVTLVDATATLGATDVDPDRWGADVVVSASHLALGCPAGVAFATVSDRLLVRAGELPDRGVYLDLVALHAAAARGEAEHAPAWPQLFALARQLERIATEGLDVRWARHRAMREMVEAWTARTGCAGCVPPPGRRADALSALRLPTGRSAGALARDLEALGWAIATAPDDPADRIIRIGHMGDAHPDDLAALLATIETRL